MRVTYWLMRPEPDIHRRPPRTLAPGVYQVSVKRWPDESSNPWLKFHTKTGEHIEVFDVNQFKSESWTLTGFGPHAH